MYRVSIHRVIVKSGWEVVWSENAYTHPASDRPCISGLMLSITPTMLQLLNDWPLTKITKLTRYSRGGSFLLFSRHAILREEEKFTHLVDEGSVVGVPAERLQSLSQAASQYGLKG